MFQIQIGNLLNVMVEIGVLEEKITIKVEVKLLRNN